MKSLGHGKMTAEDCLAMREILDLVGDKWSVLLIVNLGSGPRRFSELKRAVDGISQRMLTRTLRGLERDGLVSRKVTPTIPPRVDYKLTKLGGTLVGTVTKLAIWAHRYRPQVERARDSFARGRVRVARVR